MTDSNRRRGLPRLALGALLALLAVTGAEPRSGSDVPFQLREELESVLKRKAEQIYDEKNEQGRRYQRGGYGKRFTRVDDHTYQAIFIKDTVSDEHMRNERFLITLSDISGVGIYIFVAQALLGV